MANLVRDYNQQNADGTWVHVFQWDDGTYTSEPMGGGGVGADGGDDMLAWRRYQSDIQRQMASMDDATRRWIAQFDRDTQIKLLQMNLNYQNDRLKLLEIPAMQQLDARARHQMAQDAAIAYADLSGWIPAGFEDQFINAATTLNNATAATSGLVAPQMTSDDMANIRQQLQAAGWGGGSDDDAIKAFLGVAGNDPSQQDLVARLRRGTGIPGSAGGPKGAPTASVGAGTTGAAQPYAGTFAEAGAGARPYGGTEPFPVGPYGTNMPRVPAGGTEPFPTGGAPSGSVQPGGAIGGPIGGTEPFPVGPYGTNMPRVPASYAERVGAGTEPYRVGTGTSPGTQERAGTEPFPLNGAWVDSQGRKPTLAGAGMLANPRTLGQNLDVLGMGKSFGTGAQFTANLPNLRAGQQPTLAMQATMGDPSKVAQSLIAGGMSPDQAAAFLRGTKFYNQIAQQAPGGIAAATGASGSPFKFFQGNQMPIQDMLKWLRTGDPRAQMATGLASFAGQDPNQFMSKFYNYLPKGGTVGLTRMG